MQPCGLRKMTPQPQYLMGSRGVEPGLQEAVLRPPRLCSCAHPSL